MQRPRAIGIIPARLASSRFPEKVLASETGKPLIVHVLEQALRAASLDAVFVAADHRRIVEAVERAGGRAVLTRVDHPNGTSRLAEALELIEAGRPASERPEIVVNIQGDEPEIEPESIDAAVELLARSPWAEVATIATPFAAGESPLDPNLVKVVLGEGGRALYFSRAAIPHHRDAASGSTPRATPLRHVGLYAYRAAFLPAFAAWPTAPLEETESLEQLRVLERGHGIAVSVRAVSSQGIDTPEQYAAFVRRAQSR
ncbi:MAG: 3-deoxy-manno-octulosonate cytidylyltransferase [Phycisphaera sp.]|nr:3-deoxy-manno-octulosonate cytidylyltransferase [Phycisphaera sp.]